MSNGDNVTTFSGFGSWMSTLAPSSEHETQQFHELPVDNSQSHHNNHQVFELPAEDGGFSHPPVPAPKPSPNPLPPPVEYDYYDEYDDQVANPVYRQSEPVPRPDPLISLVVKGLQKPNTLNFFEEIVKVPLFCSLYHISDALIKKGYKPPVGFGFSPRGQSNLHPKALPIAVPIDTSKSVPEWSVFVTDGPSCYDPKEGLRVNRNEGLSEYCSRLQVQVRCIDSQLVINNDLRIGFHRTLRVPEDQKTHNLPISFGRFSLRNVAAYEDKLKKSNNPSLLDMAKKSGVFFTMYQREAMWLSFRVAPRNPTSEYAIRVFAGGINVVSGRKWDTPEPLSRRKQDYVIVPPQEHLDGISIGGDTVKQFIAMPIGSGYSIEKQMTGKEDVGGLQLEINPTTAKLAIRLRPGNWNTLEPSKASAAVHGIRSGSDIFLIQDGNGGVVMGSHPEENKYMLLRELLSGITASSTYLVTALYPTKLKVTVPSRFSKQTVITEEFSPFVKLEDIAKATIVSGKDIFGYSFTLESKSSYYKTLPPNFNLIDAGVVTHEGRPTTTESDLPLLTALKPDGKTYATANPLQVEPNRLKKNRFSFGRSKKSGENSAPHAMAPSAMEYYSHTAAGPGPSEMSATPAMKSSYPQYSSPNEYSSSNQHSSPTSYMTSAPNSTAQYQSPSSYTPSSAYSSPPYQSSDSYTSAQQSAPAPYSPAPYSPPQQYSSQAPQQGYGATPPAPYSAPARQSSSSQYSSAPQFQQVNDYSPMPHSPASSTPYEQGTYSAAAPSITPSSHPTLSSTSSSHSPSAAPFQTPRPPDPKEDAWTMGIAAGGKLRQQILPDNDIYRMSRWSKTATSMISVQVLNSVAYEAITGMVAPPTPITLQNYLSAGIPFFSSYKSGPAAQTSGSTNFKIIKSVSEIDSSFGVDEGVSVAASQRVACTSCRRNLCDCVIRPCNHAFCSSCVHTRMRVGGKKIVCRQCSRVANSILGFSAPMSLPGEDAVVPKDVPVVVLPGLTGKYGSIAELA